MKLTARMMLYILGVVMAGMLTSSIFIYTKAEQMFIRSTEDTQRSLAQGTAAKLDTLVTGLKTYVHLQSEGARILNTLTLPPDVAADKREKIIKLGLQQIVALKDRSNNSFESVTILNLHGEVVTSTNPSYMGSNFSEQPFFKNALSKETLSISRPMISKVTGKPVFVIGDPIINKSTNKPVGVLVASANIATISAESVDAIKVAERGYAFALDAGGMVIMHPDSSKILNVDTSSFSWVQNLLGRQVGTLEYDWEGQKRVAAFATVPNTGWKVIVTAELSDILTPVMSIRNISMVTTLLMLIAIAGVIFIIVRGIVASLGRGVAFAQAVAAGDLSREWRLRRTDEIGVLGRALQVMVDNLKKTLATAEGKTDEAEAAKARAEQAVHEAEEARAQAESARYAGMQTAAGRIEGVVSIVSGASGKLNTQIGHAEGLAGNSAHRLEETAAAMEEMNETVLRVSHSAVAASETSGQARQRAEEGADIVNKVVDDIARMQSQSLELKADMETLGQQAEAINNVMGVISDIADQTNLLALNAAIEAARAGDAGRGFAVVADEVRKLAEKTMGSTTEVGKAIREIQQSARKNMGNVDRTTEMISSTTALARKSGETLRGIVELVDTSSHQVGVIAEASHAQSSASGAISRSIAEVNDLAGDTAQAMAEASQAVAELAQQAQVLKGLVEDMKKN